MRIKLLAFLVPLLLLSVKVFATHLRAADIIVEQECNSLRYKITVRVYLNTLSGTPFGGFNPSDGHLNFGDGSPLEIIFPGQVEGPEVRPDLGPEISVASYTTFHTYGKPGIFRVTYFERDRSGGILNILNSHDVAYSTFVIINARADHCNTIPLLQVAPVDRGCNGVVFYHNAGATDIDGDSLSYEITIPSKDSTSFVDGFRQPDHASFYTDFDHGNEAGTGRPTFKIDHVTGLITWDAPGMQGEYNIAFKIVEWRFDVATGQFFVISTSIRDMQIIVENCLNERPRLDGPSNICIEAGQTLSGSFFGTDPENHPVKIEVFSSIFEGGPEAFPATYDPVTNDFRPSDPPAQINIEWKTNCIHVRDQAYQVVIKITDSPPDGPRLVTFHTWNIRVIAPAPAWTATEPDLVDRTAQLKWEEYSCQNAEKIQLWRKVGSFPFLPGPCTAGLSIHKGYTLLREFDPSVTSFTDTNEGRKLSVGAQYCYRLVAIFSSPAGGKSYVSQEACVGPILADAPVITHVTINRTDSIDGEVEIRWTKPFDISAIQYPEPYQYEIYRAQGFTQDDEPVNVSGRISDLTSFVDDDANTADSVYNYQIVLYSRTENNNDYNPIDTASVASSVRLTLEPGEQKMLLRWDAVVPWSNVVVSRPYHRIYRGEFGQPKNSFQLIDSVEVSEFGFEYTDEGKFQNLPLQDDIYYSYYVETIGSYGHPAIPLLFNHSQIASSYPVSNLPPCTPSLNVSKTDCQAFIQSSECGVSAFENEISWSSDDLDGCRKDVVSYKLYYADELDGEYKILKVFSGETVYSDPVQMLARCYKVSAVDTRGVESELSEAFCNENCPYFDLPNVFTPNDDGCNDVFSAYVEPGHPESPCDVRNAMACPRFVKNVSFRVYNRWGRQLYEFTSDEAHSSNINWNGKDSNGDLLDSGVYYYKADVEFITVDPALRRKELRGWIQLLR
jgi:hypothetical protein